MNKTNRSHTSGHAAGLFGTSTERAAFERDARERADDPQTAGLLTATLSTWTIPIITVVSVMSAC